MVQKVQVMQQALVNAAKLRGQLTGIHIVPARS